MSCSALLFMCPHPNPSEGPTLTARLGLCPHLCHQTQLSQIQHQILILSLLRKQRGIKLEDCVSYEVKISHQDKLHQKVAMCEKLEDCSSYEVKRFLIRTRCIRMFYGQSKKSNYQNISHSFFMECCHLKQMAAMMFTF